MGYSASSPEPGGGSTPPEQSRAQPSNEENGYRALLDLVLHQTLLAEGGQIEDKSETLDALVEVARRRSGEPFALDPVAIELVQTALKNPFRRLITNNEEWQAMTRQVAQTLCDDPASYDRLSSMWRRLGERCGHGN
jgi:hypothetical protein